MNRSHRRTHLIAWLALAPIIVGLLVSAVVVRARVEAKLASEPAGQVRP